MKRYQRQALLTVYEMTRNPNWAAGGQTVQQYTESTRQLHEAVRRYLSNQPSSVFDSDE